MYRPFRVLAYWVLAVMVLHMDCTVVKTAKTGDDAFELKQYFISANLYEKEFEASGNPEYRAKVAYGAAVSYKKINETALSAQWFKQAADLNFGDIAWKEYASSLVQLGQYDAAITTLETLQNKKGSSEEVRLLISYVKQASLLSQEKLNFYEVNLLDINSAASDYAPILSPQGELIFTSDRPNANSPENYKSTGRAYSELFIGNPEGFEVSSFDPVINSNFNEGAVSFNSLGNIIVFNRCALTTTTKGAYCQLYMSSKQEGRWMQPIKLDFQKENINYYHPCFAANDSVLFFSSDDPKGEGERDIYYTEWIDNKWSDPERLGKRINTKYEERFPFMFNDTLYFASDRPGGLGGLDIYKTYVNEDGDWQPAINLKAPINSNEDDFALIIDPSSPGDALKGYFSSSRKGGMGKDDIYSFIRTKSDESVFVDTKPKKTDSVAAKRPIRYQVFLNVRVNQVIHTDPNDPNSPIVEKKAMPNTNVLLREGKNPIQMMTNANGNAFREIKYDSSYFVIAVAPGFLNSSKTFSTIDARDEKNPIKTINIEINLDRPFTGKEVLIADIFYDLDQWNIRQDAEKPLNELVQLLKDNPRIKIQLSSHTDCRGTDVYNMDLSHKRAKSAVDYLIQNGIQADRLVPKGFGESQLVKKCICEQCSEDEHQANRRTTFMILQ